MTELEILTLIKEVVNDCNWLESDDWEEIINYLDDKLSECGCLP